MNFAFQLADKFALLTSYLHSCRYILLPQLLSKGHMYDFFFFNIRSKGLAPLALRSLVSLWCHQLTLLSLPGPGCAHKLWSRSPHPSCGHRCGRAEHNDGTCFGINTQCFPPISGTNTLIRSRTQPRVVSLSLGLYRNEFWLQRLRQPQGSRCLCLGCDFGGCRNEAAMFAVRFQIET